MAFGYKSGVYCVPRKADTWIDRGYLSPIRAKIDFIASAQLSSSPAGSININAVIFPGSHNIRIAS